LLYVKNLSPNTILFNPDLSLLAIFAFSNGTEVSRFLGSMILNASQERVQADDFLLPMPETLQNVTIEQAPQQMIYNANSSQVSEMSNYSSIRVGNIELSYIATYPASWTSPTCIPMPPSNCGNGAPKPGTKWIALQIDYQNLDLDHSVNVWFSHNTELCYVGGGCVADNEGAGIVMLNPGQYIDSGSIFQINATSFLIGVIYLPFSVTNSTS
jgi:hypothetical protein